MHSTNFISLSKFVSKDTPTNWPGPLTDAEPLSYTLTLSPLLTGPETYIGTLPFNPTSNPSIC